MWSLSGFSNQVLVGGAAMCQGCLTYGGYGGGGGDIHPYPSAFPSEALVISSPKAWRV